MKIAFGCDPNAAELKQHLLDFAKSLGHDVVDYGSDDPLYANVAVDVARDVAAGACDRGVLVCGTGIGVAMSANKVPGIRAAQTHDTFSAERAAKSNNAHIITFGARVIGPELAKTIVNAWLASEFDPQGASAGNVAAVNELDRKYRK